MHAPADSTTWASPSGSAALRALPFGAHHTGCVSRDAGVFTCSGLVHMGTGGPETLGPGRSRARLYTLLPPRRVLVGRKREAKKDIDGEAGPAGATLQVSVLPELSGAPEARPVPASRGGRPQAREIPPPAGFCK